MKREFYLIIEGIDDRYADPFFNRFGKDLKKEKVTKTKLIAYEDLGCGRYIITLDSRNFGSNRIKINKTQKFPEKIEKHMGGVYLPDTLKEFLQLYEKKSTLIELGEGRDAVTAIISAKERKLKGKIIKEYYLKGNLLNRMKAALTEELPLEKMLKEWYYSKPPSLHNLSSIEIFKK